MSEAHDRDRSIFEKAWKVKPISFFGSLDFLLKYKNSDEKQGYKSVFWKYFPVDFEHVQEWLNTPFLLAIGAIGAYLFSEWYLIAGYCLAVWAVRAFVTLLTYNYLNERGNKIS